MTDPSRLTDPIGVCLQTIRNTFLAKVLDQRLSGVEVTRAQSCGGNRVQKPASDDREVERVQIWRDCDSVRAL
jgi:hypothetical protein